jgi:hypothetical protein
MENEYRKNINKIPFTTLGIMVVVGFSKEDVTVAMDEDFGLAILSGVIDFGYSFLTTGGGVERLRVSGFSKLAARALNAGERPRTRTLSGLKDTLLER